MQLENKSYFLIKRNPRGECKEPFVAIARRCGTKIKTRDTKNVYRIILSHLKPAGFKDAPIFIIVEVSERLTDNFGNDLLFPEVEVASLWTNVPEDEAICIKLYHKHATSEQSHSELKSDMNLEGLPSDKSVLQDLIHVDCKFKRHANRIIVKFGRNWPWDKTFEEIYARCL